MSAAAPVVDETLDVQHETVLRDLLAPPACEWHLVREQETCGLPAEWVLVQSCGHDDHYCPTHAEWLRRWLDPAKLFYCADPRPPRHARYQPVTFIWRPIP